MQLQLLDEEQVRRDDSCIEPRMEQFHSEGNRLLVAGDVAICHAVAGSKPQAFFRTFRQQDGE